MKPRILIIGLDAATMDLVAPWARAGHLPVLASMMREGTSCQFLSTPNMHSASAWTSILTGLNPGRHGLFVFSDRNFATGRVEFYKGGDRTGDLVTQHLARHDWSSGLLNVPMTYPASCCDTGFTVSGLDAPSLNESAFCPASLRLELFQRYPNYNFSPPGLGDLMRSARVGDAMKSWLSLIETQTAAAEYLLDTRPVDFFMTVFTASDWGGHNLWPASVNQELDDGQSPLLSIYRALDNSIGRLLKYSDDNTHVYVISDHGMGPHTGASYYIADWLVENGYMFRKHGAAPSGSSMLNAARNAARRALPPFVKEKLKTAVGQDRIQRLQSSEKDSFYSSIDWDQTVGYTEPGRHVINISLAGRNLDGIVAQSDYDRVRDEIIADLAKWTDADGRRVVDHVIKKEDAYQGPFVEKASDLYVYWNSQAHLGDPPPEVKARGFWWRGDHRPQGILICKGPAIRSDCEIDPPVIYDLVPTLIHMAGLPVPEGLDGRVIEDLCTDDFRCSNEVRFEKSGAAGNVDRVSLSESEEEVVAEKLRGLGYM
jgi:predicted AlkP superfamily phosphohydrolase/phosphomutase